ncbi:hypothetical protein RB195_021055 [Necator americanus]
MTISTCKARTLAWHADNEDLMTQPRRLKYDVIGVTETRRRHPLNAVYEIEEETIVGDFSGKICPRRTPDELHIGTHGVQWDEQGERLSEFIMTTKALMGTRNFRNPLLYAGHGSHPVEGTIPKLTTSSSIKGFALRMSLLSQGFIRVRTTLSSGEDFSFTRSKEKAAKVTEGISRAIINWDLFALACSWEDSAMDSIDEQYDRLAEHLQDCMWEGQSYKIGDKRDFKERRGEVLAKATQAGKIIRHARREFANPKTKMTALRNPNGTTTASRRGMEKIIYSDLFDSHAHLTPHHLMEDGYVLPEVPMYDMPSCR